MEPKRVGRVAEALREELAELVGWELSDPRLATVDVCAVEVAPDLRHAHVRVGVSGTEEERKQSLEALENARHFLRRQLSVRLQIYRTPELHFSVDPLASSTPRIGRLMRRIRRGRPRTDPGAVKKTP